MEESMEAASNIQEKMREEWDRRAREDAYFYAAFARRQQSDEEFFSTAAETLPTLEKEFVRLQGKQVALEIGQGPGRLMRALSAHFEQIHGVDISTEMVARAQKNLAGLPNATVHHTPNSDLRMFEDNTFDFVYSYTVFQHIPDKQIVLNYISEARRVLKPGGILCAQLRGTPPLEAEFERDTDTWTGCTLTLPEVVNFAVAEDFPLMMMEGVDTQYFWTTWQKPVSPRLTEVTDSESSSHQVTRCASLWMEGVSSQYHLGNLQVDFNGVKQYGCYLSPDRSQMNVMLPRNLSGTVTVTLFHDSHEIEVIRPGLIPKVVMVSDAINLASKYVIETGGAKVTLEGIEAADRVTFRVNNHPVHLEHQELKDPLLQKYEYSFYLPPETAKGQAELKTRAGETDLPPVSIMIA